MALVLLCLVAHLFFINAAHHHRAERLSAAGVVASGEKDARDSKGANSDAACLSCRAARAFVSAVPSPAFPFELILSTTCRQPRRAWPLVFNPGFILSSRAPPVR
ncbi:MAG TPA: hypothetical protein VKA60_13545 [Blastocatellia bacterium]|nr:hypothetical protein [Blastocatellia bacterium]